VQLAVECLTHAHNKNFWHVTLIAGDLDFEPLVVALVNVGAHVRVLFEKASAAKGLYHAADVAQPMTLSDFWHWSTPRYRADNPTPHLDRNDLAPGSLPPDVHTIPSQGTWRGRPVYFCTSLDPNICMLHFVSSQFLEEHNRSALLIQATP
jgi:NYN domain